MLYVLLFYYICYMKSLINSIKPKEKVAEYPLSIRPYAADLIKLKLMAKEKGMKLHPFIVEALHVIANS